MMNYFTSEYASALSIVRFLLTQLNEKLKQSRNLSEGKKSFLLPRPALSLESLGKLDNSTHLQRQVLAKKMLPMFLYNNETYCKLL